MKNCMNWSVKRKLDHLLKMKTRQSLFFAVCCLLMAAGTVRAKVGLLVRFADDVILENLEVGRAYNLRQLRHLPYKITNAGDGKVRVVVEVVIPREKELKPGYEAIPDPSWVKVLPGEFILEPGESSLSEVIIAVPDSPEYLNRNFQTQLWAHTVGTGFMASGVAHRMRFSTGVGPETLLREKKKKLMFTLDFEITPLSVYLTGVEPGVRYDAGKKRSGSFKVTNRADDPIEIKMTSVPYDKQGGLPPGYEPSPDPSWLIVEPGELKVESDTIERIRIFVEIPDEKNYYGRKYAFMVKSELIGIEVPVEVYNKIYVTVKK